MASPLYPGDKPHCHSSSSLISWITGATSVGHSSPLSGNLSLRRTTIGRQQPGDQESFHPPEVEQIWRRRCHKGRSRRRNPCSPGPTLELPGRSTGGKLTSHSAPLPPPRGTQGVCCNGAFPIIGRELFCKHWHMGGNYFLECPWRGFHISPLAGIIDEVAAARATTCNPLL